MRYNFSDAAIRSLMTLPGINPAAVLAALNSHTTKIPASRFKKLALDKGMYKEAATRKLTFTDFLEELDPSQGDEGLDAFERQLVAHNLQVNGAGAITLEEWYNQPDSRVLFPEFINRQLELGRLLGRFTVTTQDLVAVRTTINSGDYRSAIIDMDSDAHMRLIAQGSKFPRISITISDKTIELVKHGALIAETYEHMRRVQANKMAAFFQLIGWNLELDQAEDAVGVLVNGNTGNSNSAVSFTLAGLSRNNFVEFLAEFDPYSCSIWVMDKAGWTDVLQLPEFADNLLSNNFNTTGVPISPFGVPMKRHDTSTVLANKILGVDTAFALEEVTEAGSMIQETDRVIDGQWNEITISVVRGYAKMIVNSTRLWDYSNEELP